MRRGAAIVGWLVAFAELEVRAIVQPTKPSRDWARLRRPHRGLPHTPRAHPRSLATAVLSRRGELAPPVLAAPEAMGRGGSAEVAVDATDVLKPRTDLRHYRCVCLGNALQALIISDPETDKVRTGLGIGGAEFCVVRFGLLLRCCADVQRFSF